MAVAFDATSNSGLKSSVSSYTFSHTTASGGNRFLVVGVQIGFSNTRSVSGITYSGVALTKLDRQAGNNNNGVEIWYLKDPAVGTADVAVTYDGSATRSSAVAWTFTGVDLGNPFDDYVMSAVDNSATLSQDIVTTSDNCIIVDIAAENSGNNPTAVSGQTTDMAVYDSSHDGLASHKAATTAGTYSMGWEGGNSSSDWAHIVVAVRSEIVSSATVTTFATSVTSMPVNLPASIASGNLLIAHVGVRNPGTWTVPSGWTVLAEQAGGGGVGETCVWYKIADGTEGATATWTAGTATTAAWQVRKITSWHGTTPPEYTSASGDFTTAPNPPSLTPSWGADDTIWLALAGSSATAMNFTAAPTNYSDLVSTVASSGGGASNAGSAYRVANTATEDPGLFTTSQDRWWATFTVAVRPAGGGGGGTDVSLDAEVETVTTSQPSVTVSTTRNITTIPAVQTVTSSQPAATVTAVKNVSVSAGVQSSTVSQPTSTVSVSESIGATTQTVSLSQPTATVTTIRNISVSPDPQVITTSIISPSIVASGDVSIAVGAQTASLSQPDIVVSIDKSVSVSQQTIASSQPTASVTATQDNVESPSVLSVSLSQPEATVTITGDAVVSVDVLDVTASAQLASVVSNSDLTLESLIFATQLLSPTVITNTWYDLDTNDDSSWVQSSNTSSSWSTNSNDDSNWSETENTASAWTPSTSNNESEWS